MARIALVISLIISLFEAESQNLLFNPDFESVVPHPKGDLSIYRDSFYARGWFSPTAGTVDIFQDFSICHNDSTMSYEGMLHFCVNVQSGHYCIGLLPLTFFGNMEHLTGKLKIPMREGKSYKIAFYVKFIGHSTPYVPNGIGYKLSQDSMLFKSNILFENKISPFYYHIFQKEKIYADFEISEYLVDTTWQKYESIYRAKGGEQFITVGRFAYKSDKKIIKQFEKLSYFPSVKKIEKFLNKKNSSLTCKNVTGKKLNLRNEDFPCYYLFDNFSIIEIESP